MTWLIENEIYYVHYSGVVTVEELRACMLESYHYVESSPRELVHIINDIGDVIVTVSMKDSMNVMREVGIHPRTGWSFTIGEKSNIIKMVSGLGASVFKVRYRAFDVLDEALEHLKSFDTTISWDKFEVSLTEQVTY